MAVESKIKCIHCGRELPVSEFYPSVLKRNYHICRKCHNKKTEKYNVAYHRRRREREKEQLSKSTDPEKYLGGYNIRILNTAKKGEYKFNILGTGGYSLATNDKKEFFKKLTALLENS